MEAGGRATMLRPSRCTLYFSLAMAVFVIATLAAKGQAAGLQALDGAPALPLIQALLEQVPPKPRVLWKRQVSSQHLNYMLDLYRKSADKDGRPKVNRTVDSNMVRLVKPFGTIANYVQDPWITQTLRFHLDAIPVTEQLVRAAVVYSHARSVANNRFSCKVELLDGGVTGKHPPHNPKFGTRQRIWSHNSNFNKWEELDLTLYLKSLQWEPQNKPSPTLNLQYLCIQSEKINKPLNWPKTKDMILHHPPFLLLYLNTRMSHSKMEQHGLNVPCLEKKATTSSISIQPRRARQAGNIGLKLPSYHQKNSISKNQCTLHSFRVSFHQLGWDHWIIAPHRYNPKYCKGDCPRVLRYGYNSPNHAIVQNFINELVDQSVPRPSCVPYKYSPISVLMIEANGSILYKEYENMIAESCTCR
ncbi:bone morphogenetic protein 15 [Ambystoma mexicanum]|uniref:bone morphogenetic protein 15 n=1 Tax=Ambystoma mexicanum TaxID=8296 RepID=UPI0037E86B6A